MGNRESVARFLQAWREDYSYQTLTGAAMSFGVTVLFALYHGYLGLRYGSPWHGSIGIFYGSTAQLCLRPSPNLLPHPCSYKRGKYIQYSRPFITFV